MHRVHDRELFGLQVASIDVDAAARTLTFALADHGDDAFDAVAAGERLAAAADAAGPGTSWQVVTLDEPRRRVAAPVTVPPLGWASISAVAAASAPEGSPITLDRRTLDNGLVRVEVAADGTLAVTGDGVTLSGVGRVVDGGDCGDSYNYGPPGQDQLIDEPRTVSVAVDGETGPVVGALVVTRVYDLPLSSDAAGRSPETVPTPVTMRVEVRTGEAFVRISLDWENRSTDHRLRLHVPTAGPAAGSHAQGQLAVVARGRTAEDGPVGEHPIATFPAERFVDAGGAGVVLGRTMEYEVVDAADGTGLALTLSRSIGYLSRNVHPHRSEPAGPQLATPDAQVLRPGHAWLVVVPHSGDWAAARMGEVAEAVLHPVHLATGNGAGALPLGVFEGLSVSGAGVDLLSLRRRPNGDGRLEVRVVNSSDSATTAVLGSAVRSVRSATMCDGLGRRGDDLVVEQGIVRMPLRPWEIATVAVAAAPVGH
jgi:alpha-mannosidase